MFFDNFENFYQKYLELNKNNNNKNNVRFEKDNLKLFWIKHCSMLYEEGITNNNGIKYTNKISGLEYNLFIKEDEIIVKPFYDAFHDFNNFFVLSIGKNLKCVEIRDGDLVIEIYNPNLDYIYIDIYDKRATTYFCESTKAKLGDIDYIEKYIKTERLLPDKSISVIGRINNKIRVNTYKMKELINTDEYENASFRSLYLTKLDIDELLNDVNKRKIK